MNTLRDFIWKTSEMIEMRDEQIPDAVEISAMRCNIFRRELYGASRHTSVAAIMASVPARRMKLTKITRVFRSIIIPAAEMIANKT